jgi:hypothetical protein
VNNLFDKKTYILLFGGFFILESILAIWTGMQYDMDIWFNTGKWMQQGINIYMPLDHVGYPPLWPFWCNLAYRIYLFFGNNFEMWRFAVKLPLIFANLGLAFVLGAFASTRFDRKTTRRVFLFALTCSFFIFIGAMWGQINTLGALLTFLAFYALTLGRTKSSALLLGIAIALKIYPLIVLPAFFAYVLKNKNGKEAAKYALFSVAVPVLSTVAVFAAFQWDITYLFRTIFYWTPVYQTNPVQIQGGAMNIWSFISLLNVDVAQVWVLRLVWIPVLAAAATYWLKRPRMDAATLCLSTISFYLLFMITYSWVPEQSFVDPLPFIFLQILAYRPRKLYLYLLVVVQSLIYAFSIVNWGPLVFTPFLQRFYPEVLKAISPFNPSNGCIWVARGILGLAVSLALAVFLLTLAKPSIMQEVKDEFRLNRGKGRFAVNETCKEEEKNKVDNSEKSG